MSCIPPNLKPYTDATNTVGHLRSSDPSLISQQGSMLDIVARAWHRGCTGNFHISRRLKFFGGSSQRPKTRLMIIDWLISLFGIKASC